MSMDEFNTLYDRVVKDIQSGRLTGISDDGDDDGALYIDESTHNLNLRDLVMYIYENFITGKGQCNHENVDAVMSEHDEIKIYAGEEDSFGWVTGCFEFNVDGQKYIIVYG